MSSSSDILTAQGVNGSFLFCVWVCVCFLIFLVPLPRTWDLPLFSRKRSAIPLMEFAVCSDIQWRRGEGRGTDAFWGILIYICSCLLAASVCCTEFTSFLRKRTLLFVGSPPVTAGGWRKEGGKVPSNRQSSFIWERKLLPSCCSDSPTRP